MEKEYDIKEMLLSKKNKMKFDIYNLNQQIKDIKAGAKDLKQDNTDSRVL